MKLAILFLTIGSAAALCPAACSGHGACGTDDRCSCYDNWTGPDCGSRVCPFTEAWADESAHGYAECGNKGECDRQSGVCKCYDGYTGKGCSRLACPSDCNNRGTCETMLEMNTGYTGWDALKIGVCSCDPGYTGPDCASRICKVGDDVLSYSNSAAQQQTISLVGDGAHVTGSWILRYTDWRGETWETWALSASCSGTAIKEALEGLPNHAVPSVSVGAKSEADDGSLYTRQWIVTFDSAFTSGTQVVMEARTDGCVEPGCQPYFAGLTDKHTSTGTGVSITTAAGATNELWTCSGRGTCDAEEGACECVDGYHGEACEMQTIIV